MTKFTLIPNADPSIRILLHVTEHDKQPTKYATIEVGEPDEIGSHQWNPDIDTRVNNPLAAHVLAMCEYARPSCTLSATAVIVGMATHGDAVFRWTVKREDGIVVLTGERLGSDMAGAPRWMVESRDKLTDEQGAPRRQYVNADAFVTCLPFPE